MGEGITKRELGIGLAALVGAYALGCEKKNATVPNPVPSPNSSWKPSFTCEYLKEQGSLLRIVYCQDYHVPDAQDLVVDFIKSMQGKEPMSVLGLEGLAGVLDEHAVQRIKKVSEHQTHVADFQLRMQRELDQVKTERSEVRALLRDNIVPYLWPILACCDVAEYEVSAPGKHFALAPVGTVPLFGVEDMNEYKLGINLIHRRNEDVVSDLVEQKLDSGLATFFDENYPIKQYRAASSAFIREQNLTTLETWKQCSDASLHRRSAIAIQKLQEYCPQGTAWLIMGMGHKDDIVKECERRKLSLAIPKYNK